MACFRSGNKIVRLEEVILVMRHYIGKYFSQIVFYSKLLPSLVPPLLPTLAMVFIVALSNFWAQEPYRINDYFLWASFSYPFAFLVTDCTLLFYSASKTRMVVAFGFVVAGICSLFLSTPRIAIASLSAFALSHLLDIAVFMRLRNALWWRAPFFSSVLASIIDTLIFFFLAFIATNVPWYSLALGDLLVKFAFVLCLLLPFRLALQVYRRRVAG